MWLFPWLHLELVTPVRIEQRNFQTDPEQAAENSLLFQILVASRKYLSKKNTVVSLFAALKRGQCTAEARSSHACALQPR